MHKLLIGLLIVVTTGCGKLAEPEPKAAAAEPKPEPTRAPVEPVSVVTEPTPEQIAARKRENLELWRKVRDQAAAARKGEEMGLWREVRDQAGERIRKAEEQQREVRLRANAKEDARVVKQAIAASRVLFAARDKITATDIEVCVDKVVARTECSRLDAAKGVYAILKGNRVPLVRLGMKLPSERSIRSLIDEENKAVRDIRARGETVYPPAYTQVELRASVTLIYLREI